MSDIEQRLTALGITLPDAPNPLGNFLPYLVDGNHLHISGQIALDAEGGVIAGQLGETLTVAQGVFAARQCAIGLLARAKAALDGNLDRIEALVKLGGFVNAASEFAEHPQVINGASDLMVDVLGSDRGAHARFAIGTPGLPANAAVEIEAMFRVR